MWKLVCPLLFLCLLPAAAASLFCYTCVFPSISPMDCIRFPMKCSPEQKCLNSKAVGVKGNFRVVLYEKSCVNPIMCNLMGEKYAMGINFTFTNECCSTHFCNGATLPTAPYWTGSILTFLLSYSLSLW